MISVIVPAYNAEKTIKRCIDSILNQQYTDFELLVVNDGSTDTTGQILDEYAGKDGRIHIFHKENGGVSSARNWGLDKMDERSNFVTFCDSDDWVADTWLLDYVENYRGEDVIFQNARWHNKERIWNRNESLDGVTKLSEQIEKLYLRLTLPYIWSGMWKADIIRNHHIRFGNYKTMEDHIWAVDFCHYIHSISIISPSVCHQYNYNYYYPTEFRSYLFNDKERIRTMLDVLERLYSLFYSFEDLAAFQEINKSLTSWILVILLSIYRKENTDVLTWKDRIELLKCFNDCSVRMDVSGGALIRLCGTIVEWKTKWWADFVLKAIIYLTNPFYSLKHTLKKKFR